MRPVGTIWQRALRRVDRRAAIYREALAAGHPEGIARALELLTEACRLANRLAY